MTFEINKKKYNKFVSKYKNMNLHNIIYLINKCFIATMVLFTVYAVASPIAFTIKQIQGNIVSIKKDYSYILMVDLVLFVIMTILLIVCILIDKKKSPNLYFKTISICDTYFYLDKKSFVNKNVEIVENTDNYFKFNYNKIQYIIVYDFYNNGEELLSCINNKFNKEKGILSDEK